MVLESPASRLLSFVLHTPTLKTDFCDRSNVYLILLAKDYKMKFELPRILSNFQHVLDSIHYFSPQLSAKIPFLSSLL